MNGKIAAASAIVLVAVHAADPALGDSKAHVQAPPSALRVESLGEEAEGVWIRVPDYDYLGSPAFSPDGEWIAFDAYGGGRTAEVWIVRRDGSEPTQVAIGATPQWSPDGERLIFMREETPAETPEDYEPGIYVINRDGTGEQRIGDGRWPTWSPDGERIAYSLGGESGGGARIDAEVYIARADGTRPRRSTLGDCPSWSPDGTRLAVCRRDDPNSFRINVVDLESHDEVTLGVGAFRANWSPDGDRVICHGLVAPGQVGLVVAPADGLREFEPLFEDLDLDVALSPCFAPDGETVVFATVPPDEDE